jgi:hypothetical protein
MNCKKSTNCFRPSTKLLMLASSPRPYLGYDYTVPNYSLAWLVRVHRINTAAVARPARREKTATAGLFQAPVASREKAEAVARRANGEAYADIALTYGVAHTTILRLCEARGPES